MILKIALYVFSSKHDIISIKEKVIFKNLIKVNLLKWLLRLIIKKIADQFWVLFIQLVKTF